MSRSFVATSDAAYHDDDGARFLHYGTPILWSIWQDLLPLLAIQGALLGFTVALTASDSGDWRVQLAWFAFLLPGWWLAPTWTSGRHSLVKRYAHAVIGSFAAHGSLAGIGYLLGLSFTVYFSAFACIAVVAFLRRLTELRLARHIPWRKVECSELFLWAAVMVLTVAVFRQPRSNDIIQFVLQQQDMLASRTLQPSDIGIAALGVNEPMPRWRSHLWHLWPCLMAEATSLPVAGVLTRWAPIPLGYAVLACLLHFIRTLAGGRLALWPVAVALFGPVVLWYRSFNAFDYSFRLTNNFCLDKDFCLFFLIPAAVYLLVNWLRGANRCKWLLLALIPSFLKFHPLTPVYLVLLTPFVVIGYDRSTLLSPKGFALVGRRAAVIYVAAFALFICVMLLGDAQTSHEHITRIMQLDFDDSLRGRPLHYWTGQYGVIPNNGLDLDTNEWSGGKLYLKSNLLWNCSLLAPAHAAWLVLTVAILAWRRRGYVRLWCALSCVFVMLWSLWTLSPLILTRYPHYLAALERMHWFAYVPALVAVAVSAALLGDAIGHRIAVRLMRRLQISVGNFSVAVLLLISAITFLLRRESVLVNVRGLNSLLDYELAAQVERDHSYSLSSAFQSPESTTPDYLRPDDRVLFLAMNANHHYWAVKQGVYWIEPYAEAFALQRLGDDFAEDRRMFYAVLDRLVSHPTVSDRLIPGSVKSWLDRKRVSVMIDRRPGGDEYLDELNRSEQLGMRRIEKGVWRLRRE